LHAAEIPPISPPDWSRYDVPVKTPSELPEPSEDSYFWTVRGIHHLERLDEPREAIECFRRAISIDSNNVAAKEYLFKSLERYGETSSEIRTDRGERGASYQWLINAEFLLEKGEKEKAFSCLQRALDLNPFNVRAARLFKTLRMELRASALEEEEQDFEEEKAYPDPSVEEMARNWYLSARYHLDKGDYQQAKAALGKAIHDNPDYAKARELLEEIKDKEQTLIKQKVGEEDSNSSEGVEAVSDEKVGTARHWYWLGRYYGDVKQDFSQALACFKKAFILDPGDRQIEKALDEAKLKVFFDRDLTTGKPAEDEAPVETSGPVAVGGIRLPDIPLTEDSLSEESDEPQEDEEDLLEGEKIERMPGSEIIVFTPEELEGTAEDVDLPSFDKGITVIGDYEKKPLEDLMDRVEHSPKISFFQRKRELAELAVFLFPEELWEDTSGTGGKPSLHPVLKFTSVLSKIMQEGLDIKRVREIDENWGSSRIMELLGDGAASSDTDTARTADLSFEIDHTQLAEGRIKEAIALYKGHLFEILKRNPDNLRVLYRFYQLYVREEHMEAAALVFFKMNQAVRKLDRKREKLTKEEAGIRDFVNCLLRINLVTNAIINYNAEHDYRTELMTHGEPDVYRLKQEGYLPGNPGTLAQIELGFETRVITVRFAVGSCTCPATGHYHIDKNKTVMCTAHGTFPHLPEVIELPTTASAPGLEGKQ